ncbi:MAG: type IVB secretion system protein IcmH/DotU [Pseudomonadota bacterium]
MPPPNWGAVPGQQPSAPPPDWQSPMAHQAPPTLAPGSGVHDQVLGATATGFNPLNAAASTLFALTARIRNRATHRDPESLRASVLAEVRAFGDRALNEYKLPAPEIRYARYAICATIDDVVLSTPWGPRSSYAQATLVSHFHRETKGGQMFFKLVETARAEPAKYKNLLEFLYVCLSLGFYGELRRMQDGAARHTALRSEIASLIRGQRGKAETDLSPRWRGIALPHRVLSAFAPIWAIMGATAVLLALLFLAYFYLLSNESEAANGRLVQLGTMPSVALDRPAPKYETPVEVVSPEPDRVAEFTVFLEREIAEKLVTVTDKGTMISISIAGSNMFASGSDVLREPFIPVIDRVAEALNDKPGAVLVWGHADSDPISTRQFPNLTALSLARAKAVERRMATRLQTPDRLIAEGKADSDPLVPEYDGQGREIPGAKATNRRVEILLVK